MILVTTVYKDGQPIDNVTCNLTIFNPPPLETFINVSVWMNNTGNGVYTYNLTGILDYNKNIYPLLLYCNDSTGLYGNDDRVGIKVGINMYDFMIGGIILMGIAGLFLFMSFKVTENLKILKLFFFYTGLIFILTSLFYGLNVTTFIPNGEWLTLIFQVIIGIYILFMLLLMFLQWTDKLEGALNYMLGTK
jgi:hypothetical protein